MKAMNNVRNADSAIRQCVDGDIAALLAVILLPLTSASVLAGGTGIKASGELFDERGMLRISAISVDERWRSHIRMATSRMSTDCTGPVSSFPLDVTLSYCGPSHFHVQGLDGRQPYQTLSAGTSSIKSSGLDIGRWTIRHTGAQLQSAFHCDPFRFEGAPRYDFDTRVRVVCEDMISPEEWKISLAQPIANLGMSTVSACFAPMDRCWSLSTTRTPLPGVDPREPERIYVGDYYVNRQCAWLCPGVL